MRTWKGIIAVLIIAVAVRAQTPIQMITGNSVPDVAAFEIWLEAHCGGAVSNNMVLPPADSALLTATCTGFHGSHAKNLAAFNAGAVLGQWPNTGEYAMVQGLYNSLQASMSVDSWTAFSRFLQRYKEGIRLSPYHPSLGTVAERNLKEASMMASSMPMMQGNMTPNYSVVYEHNISFPNSFYEDTFQRVNGSIGGSWIVQGGSCQIIGNQVQYGSSGCIAYYNIGAPSSGRQLATITLGTPTADNTEWGAYARLSTTSNTGYFAYCYRWSGGPSAVYLGKFINGTWNPFPGGQFENCVAGDTITVTADGSNISAAYNGQTIIEVTDSSITSGYPGISGNGPTGPGISYFAAGTDYQIYASNYLTGNTICGGGTCPHGAYHTPSATVKFNGQGSTIYGPEGLPQSAISAQNIQTFDLWGNPPTIDLEGGVLCTVVGNIFSNTGPGGGFNGPAPEEEIAVSMFQIGNPVPPNMYHLLDWNSSRCQPPDLELNYYFKVPYKSANPYPDSSQPYLKAKAICLRWEGDFSWDCANAANLGPFLNEISPGALKLESAASAVRNAAVNGDGTYFDATNFDLHIENPAICKGVWSDPPVH